MKIQTTLFLQHNLYFNFFISSGVIKKYPQLAERQWSRASIVNYPDFETDATKIQQGDESLLTRQEKTVLSFVLLKPDKIDP